MAREVKLTLIGDSASLERAFRKAGSSASGFGSTLRSVGKIAAIGAGGAFVGLAAILKVGFSELAEGQKVSAQTGAALKSTGGVANVTAKQVSKLADSLSAMSGIDDEAIQANENLLLTFKNVRNEVGKGNKVFARATKASLNLSKAGFGSLDSAAKMMGKALNDPVKGMTALGRAGVTFTQKQKNAIKALVESNDLLGAQKVILGEVESQVGGSAAAYGRTLPGALSKLKNAFEGVTGELARGLAPVVTSVAKDIATKLTDPKFVERVRAFGKVLGENVQKAIEAIGKWFDQNWEGIKSAFRTGADLAGDLAKAGQRVYAALKDIASVTPGGAATLLGVLLATTTAVKLAAVVTQLKHMNKQFLLMGARLAPITAALIIIYKFKTEGYSTGQGDAKNLKGYIPGYGWLFGGKDGEPVKATAGSSGEPRVRIPGRAHGGPVMPGVSYTVGERGPETLTMGSRGGYITPNGGGISIGVVHVHGVQNVRELVSEIQRISRHGVAQQRGMHGGTNLALT